MKVTSILDNTYTCKDMLFNYDTTFILDNWLNKCRIHKFFLKISNRIIRNKPCNPITIVKYFG